MKKIFRIGLIGVIASCMVSCATTTPITATSNAVGNKCGIAQTKRIFGMGGDIDCGINTAAKNGGITRISHIDSFSKDYFGIVTIFGVRVYGE